MRILRISRSFPPVRDGRANHVLGLSIAQARRSHEVVIVQPTAASLPEPVDGLRLIAASKAPSATRFPQSRVGIIRFNLSAARWVLRYRRLGKVDILHAHGDIYECLVLGPLARVFGIPFVLTIHSGLSRRRRYRILAAGLLRLPHAVIAVDEGIRDRLVEMGVPAGAVRVISSGVWFDKFPARDSWSPLDGVLRIISVGRLHPVKGYDYLISAARQLGARAQRLGLDLLFDIYGDGPERARLAAQARDVQQITFHGERAPEEIIAALSRADMFALPSVSLEREIEAAPTAVIEAMASGLPVVCTNAGGLPRLITHGVNGLIVPERDAGALADAIIRLAENPALRVQMGAANRDLAKHRAWEQIASRIDEVCLSLLPRPASRTDRIS